MEYIDIVDDNDRMIGSASKEEIYEKMYIHRIVHVLISNDHNELALQLRSHNSAFCPGHWSTSVGGHVRAGETYDDAARREYREELGSEGSLQFFAKELYVAPHVPRKFLAIFKSKNNGPFKVKRNEVDQVEFFSMSEIRRMIKDGEKFHPELLFILNRHPKLV